MDQIKIKAEARTEQGTGAVRRLRRTGMIPGSVMKMKKGIITSRTSGATGVVALLSR